MFWILPIETGRHFLFCCLKDKVHSFAWCWNLDTSENRSETPWKFWNLVLEKDWENQTDLVKNEVLHRAKEERNILGTINGRKSAWMVTPCVGTAFQNTLLKDRREERTRMKTYVAVGRSLRKSRGYCKLKEEALDRNLWRSRVGRVYGVVRECYDDER